MRNIFLECSAIIKKNYSNELDVGGPYILVATEFSNQITMTKLMTSLSYKYSS